MGVGTCLSGWGAFARRKVKESRKDQAFYDLIEDVRGEMRKCDEERSELRIEKSALKTHVVALEKGWLALEYNKPPHDEKEWDRLVSAIRKEIERVQVSHPLKEDNE